MAARLEARGRSAQAEKMKLSQHIQELHTIIDLQAQGRKLFTQSCEEKLLQSRELLPPLRKAVQEDIRTLHLVQKPKTGLSCAQRHKLTGPEAGRAQKHLGIALSRTAVEVAQEKVRAEIYDQVNTCNLLQYQLRQRGQARDELQRRLRQLQDAELDDKQVQAQVIRQLQNNIEKMRVKVDAGQKVTELYLAVKDGLRKELAHRSLHLDLLCGTAKLYDGELQDMELMALEALKAARITKEDMAKVEAQFLEEREFRHRSLATRKAHRLRLKEASKKRAHSRPELAGDFPSLTSQDAPVDADMETKKLQMEHQAWVNEKLENAKAAAQCSCIWDLPSRLLEQQNSMVSLKHYLKEFEEKKKALKETLKELELKQAELKFHQPLNTDRKLEEEMRTYLQREELRLEQMRAQELRNQELLLDLDTGIDNLFARLRGITVPGQDDPVKAEGVKEKLQQCKQKLQYLVQRVADLPPDSHSLQEDNETLVKVRTLLEKTAAEDPQNLKVSLEDPDSASLYDPFEFAGQDQDVVLTREDIKKQGLRLIEEMKKRGKK